MSLGVHGMAGEQNAGNSGEQPASGLLSPLYQADGGPARAFVCGVCDGVTRTEIGGLCHLWRKHGLKRQMSFAFSESAERG
jgi:hypothetical protein